jgi:uncharacterized protein YjdB
MNIKNIKNLIACLIVTCSSGMYSCDDSNELPSGEEATVYNTIKIQETGYNSDSVTIYLLKGQQLQLNHTVSPEEVTIPGVLWTSSDEAIVKVSQDGLLSAQNVEGTAVVTLTPAIGFGTSNATPSVTIHVLNNYVYMNAVSITNPLAADEMIDVGQSYRFNAGFSTASGNPPTFVRYNWTSSNPAIATIDKSGVLRGVSQGSVTITCTPDDQNPNPDPTVKAIASVSVRQIVPIETLELVADAELNTLGYGQEYQIRFNVTPGNATVSSIEWESDNSAAISVNNKGKLTVHAMDAAMAVITATAGDIVKTLNVAVAQGRLWYSFADKFTPWTVTTADAAVKSSDGIKTTIQMSNPTNEGSSKHRGDITLVTNGSGSSLTVHPNVYRYLAVKIQFPTVLITGNNSQGCIKLEMFDNPRTIGPVYTGSTNTNNSYTIYGASEISTTEPNILVYDLVGTTWDGGFTTGTNPYNLVQFKFVIADYPVAASWLYDIYWVRTFKTMEELSAFVGTDN